MLTSCKLTTLLILSFIACGCSSTSQYVRRDTICFGSAFDPARLSSHRTRTPFRKALTIAAGDKSYPNLCKYTSTPSSGMHLLPVTSGTNDPGPLPKCRPKKWDTRSSSASCKVQLLPGRRTSVRTLSGASHRHCCAVTAVPCPFYPLSTRFVCKGEGLYLRLETLRFPC